MLESACLALSVYQPTAETLSQFSGGVERDQYSSYTYFQGVLVSDLGRKSGHKHDLYLRTT